MTWINRCVGVSIALACMPLWLIADTFPELGSAFPKAVLVVVAGLAVLLVAVNLTPGRSGGGEGQSGGGALLRPLLVGGASGAAAFAMPLVGFFPAMVGLAVVIFIFLSVSEYLTYLSATLGGLAFMYIVFVHILGVPLMASRILGQ